MVLRVGYVQTLGAQEYVAYGEDQRIEPIVLPAARGTIFDRNGKDLVLSTPAKSVGADPSVINGVAASTDGFDPRDFTYQMPNAPDAFGDPVTRWR